MTRHTFETEDFQVITGWDRPLQYHFLEIYPRHSPALYPDPVYSNLLDREDAAMSLEEIAETLRHYGITAPEGLWRDLAEDHALNRGPLKVSYDAPEHEATTVGQSDDRVAEHPPTRSAIQEIVDLVRERLAQSRDRPMPPNHDAGPPGEDMGTVYRLTWEDGGQSLYGPSDLHDADFSHVVKVERFEQAEWQFQAGDSVLRAIEARSASVILAIEEGNGPGDLWAARDLAPEATTFGRSDESPTEGASVVTRIRELADRVRDLFRRSQDRGMEW